MAKGSENLSHKGGNLGWLIPPQPPPQEAKVYTAFRALSGQVAIQRVPVRLPSEAH